MELKLYILALVCSAILSSILGFYVVLKRRKLEAPALAGVFYSLSVWSFASALEIVIEPVNAKVALKLFTYLGIVCTPVWLLLFTAQFTHSFKRAWRLVVNFIWIVPALSIAMFITNDVHWLFFSSFSIEPIGAYSFIKVEYGVMWWFHAFYSYFLIIVSIVLVVRMLILCSALQRGVLFMLLVGFIIPFAANIYSVLEYKEYGFFDLTPLAFLVSGVLFFWGLYSRKMFAVKPIALNTLFDNLPDGILVLNRSEVVVDFNQSAVISLGLSSSNPLGQPVKSILPYVFQFSNTSALNKVHIFKHKGKYFEAVHSHINNDQGTLMGYLVVIKDITEKSESEQRLKVATDRFELAIMAAGFDPWENNLITGERIGGLRIFKDLGYSAEETPQTVEKIYELVHPEDLGMVKDTLQQHFIGKTDIYTCDFRVRDKNGNYQWVANYGRIVERDADGNPMRFIGFTHSINDRKLAEDKIRRKNDELVRANSEKDKFFSIIAHDLRGPFQGFIGLTDLMSGSMEGISKQEMEEIAKALHTSAKNLYELLENLLNWALIKRGNKRFSPQRMALSTLVDEAVGIVSTQLFVKGVALKYQIEPQLTVLVDRESVKTVLRNLLSNAIKFSPRGSSIYVSALLNPKGFVDVSVKDTGVGIPDSILNKLFNISEKVSRPGTEGEPSTGLGLILCKELIEKHGGEITVESKEGEGSTFRFTLPSASLT